MKRRISWRKIGALFCPNSERPWMRSHASVPVAEHLDGDLFRIYFSSRDAEGRSFTGYVVIDLTRPERILDICEHPVLAPGELGGFDDSGAMATWLAHHGGRRYLYYIGWNVGGTVPFRNAVGLAIAEGGGPFERCAPGPILDRTMHEPHFCASCCVLPGADMWRMWYLSCTGWRLSGGRPEHRYHIKYAESRDGVQWQRNGVVAIDYRDDAEYAISRPCVVRDGELWRMWYSWRGQSYRIGYAESRDGRRWERLDQLAGIEVSSTGWDSDMVEYPFVFEHRGGRYLLYNGNGYGATGFGLAVAEAGSPQ